jgi:hypothetical protein
VKEEGRGAAEIAKRVFQNCAQIMRYAVPNGKLRESAVNGRRGGRSCLPHLPDVLQHRLPLPLPS